MHYVFYGSNYEVNYAPYFGYYLGNYKVAMTGETKSVKSYEKFHESLNVNHEIIQGTRLSVNGEELYINKVVYDIDRDLYKVYTSKELSVTNGNMTKDEAYKRVMEMQENNKRNWWKRLFG